MGNIVLLDELTINQIAAGEVIERPANVVKELVENSIDAGATNIVVEIKNGGITYIRVTDNGKGITKDDLEIAFERHATSKIRTSDDLLKVMTMGFRGEALASIAAIANVELVSCSNSEDIGNRIVVEAGNILVNEECGCPKGTSITVNNLFFNTPVRYKFLKKDFTEAGYIEDILTKIALVNTNISFKLINSGKVILSTSGNGDLKTAIHNIYGRDISENVIDVDYIYDNIKVQGVVGKPSIARSNRANQITYVNKRNIKNKTVSSAIDEAYKTIIPNGKFGFVVLNLQLDPSLVDVNVHPAKLEVRFQNESDVFKSIYHATKNALLGSDLSRIISDSENKQNDLNKKLIEDTIKQSEKFENKFREFDTKINNISVSNEDKKEILATIYDNSSIDNDYEDKKEEEQINNQINYEEIKDSYNLKDMLKEETPIYNEESNEIETELEDINKIENVNLFSNENTNTKEYKYIGTAFETYIIIEYEGLLYIIDQHALHERVMYEQVKESYHSGKVLSQDTLLPEVITLTNREFNVVKENLDLFSKSGYIIEEFGENTIKITSVPYICFNINVKELFIDILDELLGATKTYKEEREEKFISTIACKAAVKANMKLDLMEIDKLINEALKLENPFSCPHGRPTAIKMSKYEIERKFGRK